VFLLFTVANKYRPISAAVPSKVWFCDRSFVGKAGSNPAGGIHVCLLIVFCVVKYRSLRIVDHSSRGVLPSVVCLSVIVNSRQWGGLGPLGMSSHGKNYKRAHTRWLVNETTVVNTTQFQNFRREGCESYLGLSKAKKKSMHKRRKIYFTQATDRSI
jgi:hypothetical protein